MAKNDITNNENILVKVDQNNLVFIDPNSVLEDGVVKPRGTNQENFVYYVNLEADLVPRTKLNMENAGGGELTSIARGTLNLLQNKNSEYLDTSWTDVYTNQPEQRKDKEGKPIEGLFKPNIDSSAQSFGMSSVNIIVKGANFIPVVNINFIDVRGKTLFENDKESPYAAFFHLPWPIFYLTVKGYYGKAIRYRLHLVSFNNSYNESNGNFECAAKFVGSTYAFLNDISLTSILNAPYMYGIELPVQERINEQTGQQTVKLSKSSRGYQTLVSVYDEYRRKGLITIPEGVNPTLREVIAKARRLDQKLEEEIFGDRGIVDMKLFGFVKEFEDIIDEFKSELLGWKSSRVGSTTEVVGNEPAEYFLLNKGLGTEVITGNSGGSIHLIIENKKKEIKKIQSSIRELLSKTDKEFKNFNSNIPIPIKQVSYYYTEIDGKYGVKINTLIDQVDEMKKSFNEEKKKLQDKVEEKMNSVIRSRTNGGLGFEPTIRNVFGVILAGADTYLRMMDNVHFRAYNQRDVRSRLLQGFEDETTREGSIYPWPEVKKKTSDELFVNAYPGDTDLVRKLNSDNPTLWPEVEFIEEYMAVSMKITDNLAEKERTFDSVTYTFENTGPDGTNIKKTSMIDTISGISPYSDKTFASVIYELLERVRYSTLFETFSIDPSLNELMDREFETLQETVKEDYFLVDILKQINSVPKMKEYLQSFSPFERYPYYTDSLPTVPYIQDVINEPFHISKTSNPIELAAENTTVNVDPSYTKLNGELLNYSVEQYRRSIYPFNSSTYLGYQYKTTVSPQDYNLYDVYRIDTTNGFISSKYDEKMWVLPTVYVDDEPNMLGLNSQFNIDDNIASIFNTPYFHQMLYNDFFRTNSDGKYKRSAYLFLNSLPFKDLDQDLYENVKMSNVFKEVGAVHQVPYYLFLKWGSIYHRYKTYLLDGNDIMSGVTTPLNGSVLFDNGLGLTYTSGITRNNQDQVGIHPYYSSIYHQVINDYLYYDVSDTTTTSFNNTLTNNILYIDKWDSGDFTYYNSFVDNSRFDADDKRYTILPSHGSFIRSSNTNGSYPYSTDFNVSEQFNFITNWTVQPYDEYSFSGVTFPTYNQYLTINKNNKSNQQNELSQNTKRVLDLIGTFSPQILNEFERMFLKFSSERVETFSNLSEYPEFNYVNFQDILKELLTVEKKDDDDLTNVSNLIRGISKRQIEKQKKFSKEILTKQNLNFTLVNPKELNLNILGNYVKINGNLRSKDGNFDSSQLVNGTKYITLYLGEDLDGYYSEFFQISNIELNEDNILGYRSLIQIYGGWRQSGNSADREAFEEYISTNIVLPHSNRESAAELKLISNLSRLKRVKDQNDNLGIIKSFGQEPLKLETYNNFKLFNDRWTSGNSVGQRLLMEEFIFLDKANRDIGDYLFYDVKKLIPLGDSESQNLRLYGVISKLLARNNLDFRPLPAYVNFYGNDSKTKVKPSNSVASVLFGKFLDVDVEYSRPKMLVQYVGKQSNHLDTKSISNNYRFNNDTFNISDQNNNPLLITDPNYFENQNFKNSNKVVAFEVSFGDQNQGIFKGISLDQAQFKSTFESNLATEKLARSESGSGISQVDTSLFDIYKTRSYECTVTCMGNVMIQPTMFFQLKNVPLFAGAYWIQEVSHRIENNSIQTSFKGVRIPKDQLPNPKESFTASYRILYDKIMNSALTKLRSENDPTTDEVITTDKGTFKTNRGSKIIDGETIVKESGVTDLAIPFNGNANKKTIQKVKYKGKQWFRTIVSKFGESNINLGMPTQVSDTSVIKPSKVSYNNIKSKSDYFYRLDFELNRLRKGYTSEGGVTVNKSADWLMYYSETDFLNPVNGLSKTIQTTNNLNTDDGERYVNGPVDIGFSIVEVDGEQIECGIGMSPKLMKDLKLQEGDVIYFNIR